MFKLIFLFVFLPFISSLEYQKNKNIKLKPHNENITHIHNLTSLNEIPSLFKKTKNLILFFTSTWCVSCADLHSSLSKASTYEFVYNSTNIMTINCLNQQEICEHYNITSFPHMKVYIYTPPSFKETNHTPFSYELEDILEYIEKISHSLSLKPLIKLSSMKAVNRYSKNYGDVSFLLIINDDDDSNEELLNCYRHYALSYEYIPRYYFAYIYSSHYSNNYDMKIPSIVMTGVNFKDFNMNHIVNKCYDIEEFINENQYPLFIHADQKYINKMHKLKKTVIILTLNKKSISHVHQIMNMIQNIAIARRDLIFAYLDIEEDVSLITFFKIKNFIDESVIVYNFEIGKYYLDNYKDEMRIKDIIAMIDNKEIQWKSGYFIEDFLNSFGVSVDRKYIIFITFVVMAIIAIAVTMCICNVINIVDNKFKKE